MQVQDEAATRLTADLAEAAARAAADALIVASGATPADVGIAPLSVNGGPLRTLLEHLETLPDALVIPGGGSTAFTPANLLSIANGFVNVKWFGAVGDGTTDDTDAILAAIDAVATTGGVVLIPRGQYVVNETLALTNGVTLRGQGREGANTAPYRGTFLNFAGLPDASPAILIDGGDGIVVESMFISGKSDTGTAPEISLEGAYNRRIILRDLIITSAAPSHGCIWVENSVYLSEISNVTMAGDCAFGLKMGSASTSTLVSSCYANGMSSGIGYEIDGTYITVSSCGADGCLYGYAVIGSAGIGITFLNCGAESSGRSMFWLDDCGPVSLIGCRGVSNGQASASYPSFIRFEGTVSRVSVIDCADSDASLDTASNYSMSTVDGLSGTPDIFVLHPNFTKPIYISHSEPMTSTSVGEYAGPKIYAGDGSPESTVTAIVGCLYLRTDGGASTTLYVKTSGTGNTGWTAK